MRYTANRIVIAEYIDDDDREFRIVIDTPTAKRGALEAKAGTFIVEQQGSKGWDFHSRHYVLGAATGAILKPTHY